MALPIQSDFRRVENAQRAATISSSLQRLYEWLEAHHYRGYEPFDGLNSFLRPLTLGTKLGRQVLVQVVKRSAINLRPWIGIAPATTTKGMGFLARGFLRWSLLRSDEFRAKADMCLNWLLANSSRGYAGPCWGNHFDYQTRLFYTPAYVPTVVWSSLIGQAFLDSYEITGRERDLQVARGTCDFILRDLPRSTDPRGTCISYVPHVNVKVHNANALAAGLLARVYRYAGGDELAQTAREALAYTVAHQRPDGSWYYGEKSNLHWIDNWHTAYILDSLLDFQQGTGDRGFEQSMRAGWEFYFRNFFLPDGCPKYYCNEPFPIDIQCCSQSIETLCRFRECNAQALSTAIAVGNWTIANMQDPSGFFYYQRTRRLVKKVSCLHWGQGTMLSALAALLVQLHENCN